MWVSGTNRVDAATCPRLLCEMEFDATLRHSGAPALSGTLREPFDTDTTSSGRRSALSLSVASRTVVYVVTRNLRYLVPARGATACSVPGTGQACTRQH